MVSKHLNDIGQNYWEHFFDAISYSYISFKASFYFFVHSIFPDSFVFDGSREINNLNNILINKKRKYYIVGS